jgi:hypothetical protein
LIPVEEYQSLFKELEFTNVTAEDRTDLFLKYCEQEKENFETTETREDFLKVFDCLDAYRLQVVVFK